MNNLKKKKIRGSCCSRQNHYMTCRNKHRSTPVLEKILLELNHHIAKAWLIHEYLFLVEKYSGQTLKTQ